MAKKSKIVREEGNCAYCANQDGEGDLGYMYKCKFTKPYCTIWSGCCSAKKEGKGGSFVMDTKKYNEYMKKNQK